ncbi:polysaccharide lyase 8 family protein [Streptomyces sp. NPDC059740]|uniref:polysaccharide lyase 8 family protein n=1 Tax=Streptomyces sp. NPDC059740 TaxID=3346926 RepID=UPI003662D78F
MRRPTAPPVPHRPSRTARPIGGPVPHPVSRRTLLAATGAAAASAPLLAPRALAATTASAPAADDPYGPPLARARALLTGGTADTADPAFAPALAALDSVAEPLWARLDTSADRTSLWPDLSPVTDSGNLGQSHTRLRSLALAWATPGTSFAGRAEVADAVVAGLRLLHDAAYHKGAAESGNWWFWEIGAPRALVDCLVLLGDRVPAADLAAHLESVAAFVPDPDRRTGSPSLPETGANRSDKAVIVALSGLLGRDDARVALARDGLSDRRGNGRNSLFRLVTSGDGFYADGSFVQHGCVAYTGTYGSVLLGGLAYLLALLAQSPWAVTDPAVDVVYDAVERSFLPVLHEGVVTDAVRGRAISRQAAPDHVDGAAALSAVLLLAETAPASYRESWLPVVKGWLERNRTVPFTADAAVPDVARAVALLADDGVRAMAAPTGHDVLADMDRVVHRRPGWTCALALSSRRISAYEAGNGENLHGWYTGDGMTYFHTADDLGQYGDGFWPTVDPYRLPGTTVDTRHRADLGSSAGTSTHLPSNAVAGGAVLEDRFGASAMELAAEGSSLRARKAWFHLDDAVLALGADVTAGDGRTVETVLDNRRPRGAGARLLVDGHPWSSPDGSLRHLRWAHLSGFGGYVLPGGARLRVLREQRTGAWADIDTGADTAGSAGPLTREYLTLWFDHGRSPSGARYAYAVLPGASAVRTAAWSLTSAARVVANSAQVQAVRAPEYGLFAAHFWAAGEVAGVRCDGPGTVLVRRAAGRVSVAVADPGRTATTLTVTLPLAARRVRRADDSVTVTCGPHTTLTVAVGGSHGHTHQAVLTY